MIFAKHYALFYAICPWNKENHAICLCYWSIYEEMLGDFDLQTIHTYLRWAQIMMESLLET